MSIPKKNWMSAIADPRAAAVLAAVLTLANPSAAAEPSVIAEQAAAAQSAAAVQPKELNQSGDLTVSQYQIAFIGSGNLGGGQLTYQGKTYDFTIGGLGIGGFGVSSIEAVGAIYNLEKLEDFEGAYGQARAGIVVGGTSAGTLWLENSAGVYIKLDAKRKGLALSLGADAIYIRLD